MPRPASTPENQGLMSWDEVSKHVGVSPRVAKRILDKALDKMLRELRARGVTLDDLRSFAHRRGEEQAARNFESVLLFTITDMLERK